MYNVAYKHLYIAHMFSQFKENMEINQGINGPNQMKNTKKENGKRIGQQIHTKKYCSKNSTKRALMPRNVIP